MPRLPLLSGLVALVLAGCGGDGGGDGSAAKTAAKPAAPKGASVQIKTFNFQPDPLKVKAGQKVTFINLDSTTHTVTAGTRKKPDKATFDASLDQDGRFEYTFDKPGEYDYFCDLHSGDGMVGKVVVE